MNTGHLTSLWKAAIKDDVYVYAWRCREGAVEVVDEVTRLPLGRGYLEMVGYQ